MDGREGRTGVVDGVGMTGAAVDESSARPSSKHRRARRRQAMMRLLAAGVGLGALSRIGARPAEAANGDPVLAGQSVSATAPTRVSNGVSLTPDATADGVQGYAAGANNAGLFGRNNDTDGIGLSGTAPSGTGVFGESLNGFGVGGRSTSGVGVRGESTSGWGGSFAGGLAAIRLVPATSGTGTPTTGTHQVGELYADSTGVLYYCTTAGAPGTWQQVLLGSGGGGMTNPMTSQDDLIVGGTSGAPTRLAKGSNGQVLTLNGSGHVSWATPSGGGGESGSWMAPLTAPPSSGWSWVNQSTAVASRISDSETLTIAATAAQDDFHCRVRSLSATTNYTLTALIIPQFVAANYAFCGICLRESSSGKLVIWGPRFNSFVSYGTLALSNCNSPTGATASQPATIVASPELPVWLRFQDDGTNRIASWSRDGRLWRTALSVARNNHLVANEAGIFTGNFNTAVGLSLASWEET